LRASLSAALHGRRPRNPLGARAMYLRHDRLRIHGTNRPDTIGTAVSSAASGWSIPTSPTSMSACLSAPSDHPAEPNFTNTRPPPIHFP